MSGGFFKRFVDVQVPIRSCTLRCQYCYVTHHRLFDSALPKFRYDVATWKAAFAPERWGGVMMVNFCAAGETLLSPVMVDYIHATLQQGHYVMVVTNGTVDKAFERIVNEFSSDELDRLFFKFSYHYLQLLQRGLLDRFFANIRKVRQAGASFTLELTPHDELIPYIGELKQRAIDELGAAPHVTVARDEHYMDNLPILTSLSREEYQRTWGQFDSELFDFKLSIFNQKRTEFCNAGNWTFALDMMTGKLSQCYRSLYEQNILEDPNRPIRFLPIGHYCREPHCFNGHAWLGFGTIENFAAPTFEQMRNRRCVDGTEWLTPTMKRAMQTKLYTTNTPLTDKQKHAADALMAMLMPISRLKRFVKKHLLHQ